MHGLSLQIRTALNSSTEYTYLVVILFDFGVLSFLIQMYFVNSQFNIMFNSLHVSAFCTRFKVSIHKYQTAVAYYHFQLQ